MTVFTHMTTYLADDRGAVTVDWTVLSAAAVGLAIATTAILTDSIEVLSGRMDDELRTRQLSDDWIAFAASHFEPILATNYVSETQAEAVYDVANDLMNHDLVAELTAGIEALENGTITSEEIVGLVALASVAYQRNLLDDGTLDYYFGFDGSDPYYMTVANAPTV